MSTKAKANKPDPVEAIDDQPEPVEAEALGGPGGVLGNGLEVIRERVKTLPAAPGVYRMINVRGDVLYVGKARDLKKRVSSYTQIYRLDMRLQRMVSETATMEFVATHTEVEALLLEANLIKRYLPRYNVLLRDDKSFPYIAHHRRPCDPADHQASRRAQPDGRVFRSLRLRRRRQPHHRRAAARLPAAQLQRQHVRDAHAALPAVPDQALLRALRAAHLGGGLRRAGARGARLPDRQEPRDPGPPGAGDAQPRAMRWISSAPRACATASRR